VQKGYARVSTDGQDVAMQVAALNKAGVRLVVQETRSGALELPQLQQMLRELKPGDVVIVWKVDRLARSLRGLLDVADTITRRGASLRSLTEPIDTGSPIGRAFFQLLGVFSELERSIIKERCSAGRAAAIARGVRLGRPSRYPVDQLRELAEAGVSQAVAAGQLGRSVSSVKNACRLYGVRFRRGLEK
jgi:DNA invertase Pin-like site-specific DNA recombinase